MFSTIFLHELRTWFRKPIFYVFAGLFFVLGGVFMAIMTGVFSSENATITSNAYLNSSYAISGMISQLAMFCYLMIPTFVGTTIYRDFKNNMHNVLYSYPIKKTEYLLAKFVSGVSVYLILILFLIIGLMIGGYLPGYNEALMGPFSILHYFQPFLLAVMPNVVFYSAIVFAIVVFTRNMNIGFMTILCLIIIQLVTTSFVDQVDDPFWLSLADPLGNVAFSETVKYWTPIEQNERLLPFTGMILWNRLVWGGISLLILVWVILKFKFAQNAVSLAVKKRSQRLTKVNVSPLNRVVLPVVKTDFSFVGQLRTMWHLTKADVRYIILGWPFIIISFLAIALTMVILFNSGLIFGTAILPKTWVMLSTQASAYMMLFSFLLIFLYSGFLMDRARTAHIQQIVDVTPTKNWVFLLSQFFALFIMVAVLQTLLILCGIGYQSIQGFTDYQFDLYLFQAYMVNVWRYVPWIFMALLIHTLVKNKWLGLALLLVIGIGVPLLTGAIGIDQAIFDFNAISEPSASDFNGYGNALEAYYTYRVYWILFGVILFSLALVFFRRGMGVSAQERLAFAKARFSKPVITSLAVCAVLFLSIGGYIWRINNVENERMTGKEREELRVNYEKDLSQYAGIPQPRLVGVKTHMHIYPESRDFKASATYTMVNQSNEAIDSLHLNLQDYPIEISMDRENEEVYNNSDYNYRMYQFAQALQPGDTLVLNFEMYNEPNQFLDNNSPVRSNGTFLNNTIYPSVGYSEAGELRNPKVRLKYGLPPKDRMPDPDAPHARDNNYIGGESDWIDFEATMSTSADQIAIAPGYLIKEWKKDGRRYFHYKMDSKMLNFYSFMSGRYEVKKEMHDGVSLEIYHHPDHTYNLDRMMKGLKEGLDYYNDNYTPYQHRQARIIEFPKSYGSFAQAFANTIPFSEGVGFIADVDDSDQDAVDYPLAITSHELAHQWWAHQVIGAKAKGATLLSESLSEYSSLKVLEKVYGKNQMRTFLKDAMDQYLSGRNSESIKENPLMYNENQPYIHYRKGSVVLYAMSDYIGEKNFNNVAKKFAEKYQFKSAPYPTAPEFVEDLRAATPDSLQYLIKDMFETITLYDSEVTDAEYTQNEDGTYEVSFDALVTKYRSDKRGEKSYASVQGDSLSYTPRDSDKAINSLPLADYIEIGVFGEEDPETGEEEVLYLKKVKVSDIQNSFTVTVDSEPIEVGIDPYYKLIDRSPFDNRERVKEAKDEKEKAKD